MRQGPQGPCACASPLKTAPEAGGNLRDSEYFTIFIFRHVKTARFMTDSVQSFHGASECLWVRGAGLTCSNRSKSSSSYRRMSKPVLNPFWELLPEAWPSSMGQTYSSPSSCFFFLRFPKLLKVSFFGFKSKQKGTQEFDKSPLTKD